MARDPIETLFNKFINAADGNELNVVLTATAAFLAEVINGYANYDEDEVRKLYNMMANAAIVLSQEAHDSNFSEFQTNENTTQEKEGIQKSKTSWHVRGSSRIN